MTGLIFNIRGFGLYERCCGSRPPEEVEILQGSKKKMNRSTSISQNKKDNMAVVRSEMSKQKHKLQKLKKVKNEGPKADLWGKKANPPDKEFPEDWRSYKNIEHYSIELNVYLKESNVKVDWASAAEVMKQYSLEPHLFGRIGPNDFVQGMLGDCWLMAAISGVAERYKSVKACFREPHRRHSGQEYHVRIFDPEKNYRETWITVNDFIPVWNTYGDGVYHPVFACATKGEIYAMLLEKALAKHLGSYAGLHGGWTHLGYSYLCGCRDTVHVSIENGKINLAKVVNISRTGCMLQQTNDNYPKEKTWEMIVKADKSNCLMAVAWKGDGMEEIADDTGLVSGHAYTMIQAIHTSDGFKLMQCRNPWGNDEEWGKKHPKKCPWCDKSPMWDKYPNTKRECKFTGPKDDGLFWISFDLFLKHGEELTISEIPHEVKASFRSH